MSAYSIAEVSRSTRVLTDGYLRLTVQKTTDRGWQVLLVQVGKTQTPLLGGKRYGADPDHPLGPLNYVPYLDALDAHERASAENARIKGEIADLATQIKQLSQKQDRLRLSLR